MKIFTHGILISGIAALLIAQTASAGSGLTVGYSGGKGPSPTVSPGETYEQTLTANMGASTTATDVLIEVMGYGETAKTGVVALPAGRDPGEHSARSFIAPLSTVVHVAPGETAKAKITVMVPPDVGDGGRYATLRFSTAPSGQGAVGIVSAVVLTMRFTIKDSNLVHTGRIIETGSGPIISGKPVVLTAVYRNTGNHHYQIDGRVDIVDSRNTVVASIPVSSASPIPDGTRRLEAVFSPVGALELGTYYSKWILTVNDGTPLDESTGQFEVPALHSAPAPPTSVTPVSPGSQTDSTTTAQPAVADGVVQRTGTNWVVIAGAAAGAVLLALAMYLFGVRRGRGH